LGYKAFKYSACNPQCQQEFSTNFSGRLPVSSFPFPGARFNFPRLPAFAAAESAPAASAAACPAAPRASARLPGSSRRRHPCFRLPLGLINVSADWTPAEADRRFVWAKARIDGESVIVSGVDEPVAVRYARGSNSSCELFSKAGLPAAPFRTDDWPAVTLGNDTMYFDTIAH